MIIMWRLSKYFLNLSLSLRKGHENISVPIINLGDQTINLYNFKAL